MATYGTGFTLTLKLRALLNITCIQDILTDDGVINLRGADLRGADLRGVDLRGVDLSSANLIGVNLYRANLSGANLSGADLYGADLYGADLSGVDLSGVNLSGTDLRGGNLSGANLSGANLSGANLSGVNLSGANLSWANLNGVDLSGANLNRANLNGANLRGANLSNMQQERVLTPFFVQWNSRWLDLYLNHINNPDNGSLLTMMDSIDDRHADVKLRMARELMTSLKRTTTDTSAVDLPLMDILSKAPYTDDENIAVWLDKLCKRYLSSGQVLPGKNAGVLNQSVGLFTRHPELMFLHNSAFIQIIAQGMAEQSTPEMKTKTVALYETYLNDERVKPYCSLDDFGDVGKPDWRYNDAINFILLSAQPATVSAMLLSQEALEAMLRPGADTAWSNVYLYKDEVNLTPAESPVLDELFATAFPVFHGPYQHSQNSAKFSLLKALNLGGLETAFISAAGAKYSATKLVDDDAQVRLGKIFSPKLVSSLLQPRGNGLEEAHYGELIHAYNLTLASDTDKAKTLLCLAALFTKYSSSAVFGTEHESPQLLRDYAYALMEKAHGLDESLVDTDTFANWTNRLLGLNKAFSCSAVLSNLMVEHIRSLFPEVLSGIMPPAWS